MAQDGWSRQLALPFAHQPRFERADFIAGESDTGPLAWLVPGAAARWPDRRLALWGEAGSGKTHLLHVWAREQDALLLPGTALRDLPALFDAALRRGALALDDADAMPDEPALLHLLNLAREHGLPVLLAGREAPARWPVALPDLRSRLRSMQAVRLGRADEALLRALLMRLLVERQLGVSASLLDWLMPRLPRSPGAMREAARRLDEAALRSGRGVSRAIASAVLDGMLAQDPPMASDEALLPGLTM